MSNGAQNNIVDIMAANWGDLPKFMQPSYYAPYGYDMSGYSDPTFQGVPSLAPGFSPYSADVGYSADTSSGGQTDLIDRQNQIDYGGDTPEVTSGGGTQTSASSPNSPRWLRGLSTLGEMYSDYSAIPSYDPSLMEQQISPLTQSYENLMQMSKDYADPNSALNQQQREEIRTQNMEGFADLMDRQRSLATGEYSDYSTKPLNSRIMSDAIAQALKNYNLGHADRLKSSADLQYKAGSIGNILAQARQQNYYNQQQSKAAKRSAIGGFIQELPAVWDFLKG